MLRVTDSKTGCFCVYLNYPGDPKPYRARVRGGSKPVSLGYFATAEEAAPCVARSPEARAVVSHAGAAQDAGGGGAAAAAAAAAAGEGGGFPSREYRSRLFI